MRDTDAAYLAGLFDGEGSILVRVRDVRGDRVNPAVNVLAEITLTDYAPLHWCRDVTLTGMLYTLKPPADPNWSQAYRWVVNSQRITPVLCAMMPYLQIKKKQAEIAIQINELRTRYRRGHEQDIRSQVVLAAELRGLRTSKRAKPLDPDSFTYVTPPLPSRNANGQFTKLQKVLVHQK